MKKIVWWQLLLFIIGSELVGSSGSLFTFPNIGSWYQYVVKPPLNPPNWIFGPVWSTLFLLMGIAAYLIFAHGWEKKAVKEALKIFIIQFIFNVSWSLMFFGLRNPLYGFINIVILWILILQTYLKFKKINSLAGYLLLPYLAWVSFASYLNFGIMLLNR